MENKTESLIKLEPFTLSDKDKSPLFNEALMEELCFHYDNNALYKRFCDNKSFNPHIISGDLSDIPYISVNVFKELGKELASVEKEKIKITLQSSATSGVPSSIPVDKDTAKRQAKAMVKVVQEFIGKERKPFLVMDINPQDGFRQLLGARFAAVRGYLNFSNKVGYFLKADENGAFYFDTEGIKSYINELDESKPAVVFGFTYILYSEVIKPNLKRGETFLLPKGSKVIHIGGWKKLESEKISKEEFNNSVASLFGIEPEDVIDIYGFTEQMGLNYPDCKCGYKHAPLYSEVLVRDAKSKECLPTGVEGMLEFISPVPHSYPGNVVLTDDIGVIESTPCPYGRVGTRFKILGRLKKAEVRGCGDILSSKLKFQTSENTAGSSSTNNSFKIEYWRGESISSELTAQDQLKQIISQLNMRKGWIESQPIDALIGLIGEVVKKWTDPNSVIAAELKDKGIGFLAAWCAPEHLVRIATLGLRGNRMYMDTFLPMGDTRLQYLKATSRGLACHWLAGNVQVLGMFALVQCILTKNVNLLKVSSKDDGVFNTMLSAFEGATFTTKGGYTITGDELLETIAVVYFSHNNKELGVEMSKSAAIRVAWGGREAVETVANYPAAFDCEDIILGPKISFSAVASERLNDERKAKKLARKIAVDASVFDQTGCASTHNIYIERGGEISPKSFCTLLAEGMKKVALQIPKGSTSTEQIAAIHSIRSIYDFKGDVFASDDSTWTILYSEDPKLSAPIYSRVLFVHPVNHIDETLKYIDDNIQTIGLSADGQKAIRYAEQAVQRGVSRLPEAGRMLNFESPWDGIFIMDRLVRWNTLGGPLV